MNAQNYTQKSLEAIQAAQKLTIENQNQQIEQIHLLAALLKQENGLVPQLLKKMGVTLESFEAAVDAELAKLPRVTGSGREADKYYVEQRGRHREADERRICLRRASVFVPDRKRGRGAERPVPSVPDHEGGLPAGAAVGARQPARDVRHAGGYV